MDMIDTTTSLGKGMFSMYKKFDAVRLSGYMQPQFQYIQTRGAESFAGGDFKEHVDNRFMLRRGRIKVDYERFNKEGYPVMQFAFQFDGTERGVNIRDFFGRFFENKLNYFSMTIGVFARPIGWEVNYSSSVRETPERGRMSQILMKTERDLGVMFSFEPRQADHPLRNFKVDLGFFNGQGLSGSGDYDSHKDIGTRIALKPKLIANDVQLSAGASMWYGGIEQFTNRVYKMQATGDGHYAFKENSDSSNIGEIAPRHYFGADAQLRFLHPYGKTEFRAEYLAGTQTATAKESETPGIIPIDIDGNYQPLYIRRFDGAYFYFLQNLGSKKHQFVLKYDWYDPNKRVKGTEIGAPNTNTTPADIRYDTFGFGYVYYFDEHLKATFYYDMVKNEDTALPGYTEDLKDNVFTCRLQFQF
ncbi:porin [Chitinophaga caeni]|uniref:Porin n=2 Tax=Chitinophaga caeni TaxID=2029983 RepID=A0A291R0P3_9BACT|nr:porin [Chitinophaga caeni]